MSSRSIGVTKVELSALDDFVGDLVALLLGLEDLAAEALVVGPGEHHLVEQPRRVQGVLASLDEEVEEGAVAGQ